MSGIDSKIKAFTKELFYKNEVKTNRIVSLVLLVVGVFYVSLPLLEKLNLYYLGIALCGWIMFFVGVVDILFYCLARHLKFERAWIKYTAIYLILFTEGSMYFFYPLNANAATYIPVLTAALYFDRRLVRHTAVWNWLVIVFVLFGNVYFDAAGGAIKELHNLQEVRIWSMPGEVFSNYFIPRTVFFLVTAAMCVYIAKTGADLSQKQGVASAEITALEAELNTAADIQLSALPETEFSTPDGAVQIRAFMRPARVVGGDFYDYFEHRGNIYFLVADVSDKGLSAAMYMMRAKSVIRTAVQSCDTLEQAVFRANDALCEGNAENMFVTLWLAGIHPNTGIGKYINVGHVPPLLCRADGVLMDLETSPEMPLGLFSGTKHRAHVLRLSAGDALFAFTDGVTDAQNAGGNFFGRDGLTDFMRACIAANEPVETTLPARLHSFSAGTEQFDDATGLTFRMQRVEEAATETLSLPADRNASTAVQDHVNELLKRTSCPESARREIDIILDEIIDNIVSYAYADAPGCFSLKIEITSRYADFVFGDEGIPFNPLETAVPSTDKLQVGGMGIYFVKQMVDVMEYSFEDGENRLHILKIYGI